MLSQNGQKQGLDPVSMMATAMSGSTNPYEAPRDTDVPPPDEQRSTGLGLLLSKIGFHAGLVLLAIGTAAFFVRNVPSIGILVLALICFIHSCIANRIYRKRAAIGALVTFALVIVGFMQVRYLQAQLVKERAMRAQMQARQAVFEVERIAEEARKADSGE